ncbi:hypothetical protein [Cohnella yongneupensis]|uniref:Sporulation protein n=1 Tax=Cohnella yongneupensis TaxID=425006 RepID=A0ABW0QYG4_9BACL
MHTQKRKLVLIALAACALLLASGCGKNANNNGTTNGIKAQNYADDGYLGRTNSYPKIPGHHMTSTYSNDSRMIGEAIKNVPGVAGTKVVFNGADAYVTIKLAPGLKPNEIPTVESQAASVLRFNFPRYTIHMSSMK